MTSGAHRFCAGGGRRSTAPVFIAMLVLAAPCPPVAAVDWDGALASYARNPFRNRRALLALRGEDPYALPPVHLLALGEASLRGRRFTAARRQFDAALARGLGEPWDGWARVGLAWIALAREDHGEARRQFAAVAGSPASPSVGLARLGMALLDAAAERPEAAAAFASIAEDQRVGLDLRRAARLGFAYTLYWQEEYARAAGAFDGVAADGEVGALWDDARYGAAWARLRAGDHDAAAIALAHLATGATRRGRPTPRALVNLEPQAILRAGFERYRRGPLDTPEAHLARVLDGDGYALAAAAMREFGATDAPPPRPPLTAVRARMRGDGSATGAAGAPRRLASPSPTEARPPRRLPETTGGPAFAGASAVVCLAVALWRWLATRGRHRRSRPW